MGNWDVERRRKFGNEEWTGFNGLNGWMLKEEAQIQKSEEKNSYPYIRDFRVINQGNWELVIDNWELVIDNWCFFSLLGLRFQLLPITCYRLPITYYPFPFYVLLVTLPGSGVGPLEPLLSLFSCSRSFCDKLRRAASTN